MLVGSLQGSVGNWFPELTRAVSGYSPACSLGRRVWGWSSQSSGSGGSCTVRLRVPIHPLSGWFCFQGVLCRTLQGHAHWVNTMALSTDYVLRTGAFEPAEATINPQDVSGSCECSYRAGGRGGLGEAVGRTARRLDVSARCCPEPEQSWELGTGPALVSVVLAALIFPAHAQG